MKAQGVVLAPALVLEATRGMWQRLRDGKDPGDKKVIDYAPNEQLTGLPKYAHFEEKYRREAHHSTLTATSDHMLVKKLLNALPANLELGLQRSTSTITATDRYTGRPIGFLEGTQISHARTAVYVSKILELFFSEDTGINVFIFGAGPVVGWIVRFLAHLETLEPGKFGSVLVKSTGPSADRLVQELKADLGRLPIASTTTKDLLAEADLVVTVTGASVNRSSINSSDEALFELADLKSDAATTSLGIETYSDEYLWEVLESGTPVVDHIILVGTRGVDCLPRFFAKQGMDFLKEAGAHGVLNMFELNPGQKRDGPIHMEAVGMPILDAYVTEHVFHKLAEAQGLKVPLFKDCGF
ncbi:MULTISPECIES: hypothetical protein [unclassified Neorhizobium]|uniref:hypothetical protein n=1 Tax=unclassified Neorhizobium TaxID=2629175 RepID=UPI001FF20B1E|nr:MULTISPECIES: hypothetical protein [unclassified Neorhizobium]MCJ9670358.1 hypothetical protein [Neorhizobium sp. SHOUNA12B]MCJ9746612.1 hypothetical protein [Neorhizobium sp. SHOUNA12A]